MYQYVLKMALGASPKWQSSTFRLAFCGAVWTWQLLCWLASSAYLFFIISPCLNIRPFYLLLIPNQLTPGLVRNFDYRSALHMLRQTEVSLCNMSLQSVDSLSHHRQSLDLVRCSCFPEPLRWLICWDVFCLGRGGFRPCVAVTGSFLHGFFRDTVFVLGNCFLTGCWSLKLL